MLQAALARDLRAVAEECRTVDANNITLSRVIPAMAAEPDPTIHQHAMWLLQTWTEACPDDADMAMAYGKALIADRQFDLAGPYLAGAFRRLRDWYGNIEYNDEGDLIALYQSRSYLEALELSRIMQRKWPASAAAPYVGSAAAFHVDRYREQVALAARVEELGWTDDFVLTRLGIAQGALGEHAASLASLDRAIALNPGDTAARQWRLVALYAAQGEAAAIAAGAAQGLIRSAVLEVTYQGTLDFAERSERGGNRYIALANYALALRALEGFYHGSAISTAWAGDEARRITEKVVTLYHATPFKPVMAPEAVPFVRRAEAEARRGNAPGAATAYAQAVGFSPWSPELRYNHALALSGQFLNDLPWAIAEMEQFIALAPGDPREGEALRRIATWRAMIDRAIQSCGGRITGDFTRTKGIAAPQLLLRALESC